MNPSRLSRSLAIAFAAIALAGTASGQGGDETAYASPVPASISPEDTAIEVGLAGSDPANIARYLLARGASGPQLSPDGSRLAYRWNVTGAPQLWIVSAEGGAPRQLTFGNGVTFFEWVPDGSALIYGADNDGNEQESYYRIALDGQDEALVLPAVENGFRSFGDFSSDSSTFAFASTERNGLDYDIYVGDLATGETNRVHEGRFGFFAHAFSPDGTKLVVSETVGEDGDNLYLLDLTSATLETVSAPDARANHTDGGIAWRPDGTGFYFAGNVGRSFGDVLFYDARRDKITTMVDTRRDAGNIRVCGPQGRYLAFTENVDGFHRLRVRDLVEDETLATPDLPEGWYTLSCGADTTRLAIGVNGWRTPGDVVVWDMASDAEFLAVRSNLAGLDPDRLVRPQSIRMMARDGVELQGLLYLPDRASRAGKDGPPPVIFEVHGGPTAQSVASFDPVVQYHVDRGFAVFEPNVRGSTGFGRDYAQLDDRRKRRDSVRDLIDMLDALAADGRIDPERAAVSGGSYGGYMVNAVLALYPDAFRAGVSRYGVADWVTALQVASPALKASDRIEYGDIRDPEWIEFYTENSPIRLADGIEVPVLYSHGVMDPRIDIAETETMVSALRANGVEAPFIRIPDEGHGWRKLDNQLFYYRAEARFLARVLSE